jgi:carboxyl-terminal processing protease
MKCIFSRLMASSMVLLTFPLVAGAPVKKNTVDTTYQNLETFSQAYYYLHNMYVDPGKVTADSLIQHAISGMTSKLDPHTMHLLPRDFEQLTTDTRGKFGGVGVNVTQEGHEMKIISAIEGSPAMRAGIQPNDEISAINGMAIKNVDPDKAIDMMRGEPGSILKLTIIRKDHKAPIEFSLVREVIQVKSVHVQWLTPRIPYVKIEMFQERTDVDLQAILEPKRNEIEGLVLDLRDNPGGLLQSAIRVADMFIESGLILSTVGRDPDHVEREFAHKKDTFLHFPIIVLINGGSASASEIVAGALQDHGRALVLGTQSFGKGSVQTLVTLADGSGLKFTVARYFTPLDRSIQAVGITPDIIVPLKTLPDPAAKKTMKESDLAYHIQSKNLSEFSSSTQLQPLIQKLPEALRQDQQLITAFTYVKGWEIFRKNESRPETLPKKEPLVAP